MPKTKSHSPGAKRHKLTEAERLHRREAHRTRRKNRKSHRVVTPRYRPDTRSHLELLERAFKGIQPMTETQRYEAMSRGPRHSVRVKMARRHRQAIGEGRPHA